MQVYKLEQNVLLLNTETKEKVNVYTFVNLDTQKTDTAVGVKEKFPLHVPLKATLQFKITKEVYELADGKKKYVNSASVFIVGMEQVK